MSGCLGAAGVLKGGPQMLLPHCRLWLQLQAASMPAMGWGSSPESDLPASAQLCHPLSARLRRCARIALDSCPHVTSVPLLLQGSLQEKAGVSICSCVGRTGMMWFIS